MMLRSVDFPTTEKRQNHWIRANLGYILICGCWYHRAYVPRHPKLFCTFGEKTMLKYGAILLWVHATVYYFQNHWIVVIDSSIDRNGRTHLMKVLKPFRLSSQVMKIVGETIRTAHIMILVKYRNIKLALFPQAWYWYSIEESFFLSFQIWHGPCFWVLQKWLTCKYVLLAMNCETRIEVAAYLTKYFLDRRACWTYVPITEFGLLLELWCWKCASA